MTGFKSKRQAAKAKLNDDDDTQVYSELFQLAVSRGLITIRTERLDDRNVNTEVSWMQGHFVACDISNEAAHGIKEQP